jgi:CRISPR-associated exonuclease Cas4
MYCPRPCALIHVEKIWSENRFTAEGRILHLRADSGGPTRRGGVCEDRAVPIRSDRLGLYGVADVVEMRPGPDGRAIPFPVEYKRGSPKVADWDRVQLCAQALCLEEMLGVRVPDGAIFYGTPRRREKVVFDDRLRDTVETCCLDLHAMISSSATPAATSSERCRGCSLRSACPRPAAGSNPT